MKIKALQETEGLLTCIILSIADYLFSVLKHDPSGLAHIRF